MKSPKQQASHRKLPVPTTAVTSKSPDPASRPITASPEVDEAILYAQQVIAKLEKAKVTAAETPRWRGDEVVLEEYIQRIRERVSNLLPLEKALPWLDSLERAADSYKIAESHH